MQALQKITGFWFYALGFILLAAYVSLRGEILGVWPAYALQYLDLPFILSALVFGGICLFQSVTTPGKKSRIVGAVIGLAVVILFAAAAVMNFWIK